MFNKIVLFLEEFKVDTGLFILTITCESISYKKKVYLVNVLCKTEEHSCKNKQHKRQLGHSPFRDAKMMKGFFTECHEFIASLPVCTYIQTDLYIYYRPGAQNS